MSVNEYGYLNGRLLVELNDPEWRLLGLDEVIQDGDEYFLKSSDEWIRSYNQGSSVKLSLVVGTIRAYRRKRQPQQNPDNNPAKIAEWISVKERLPVESDYPIWISGNASTPYLNYSGPLNNPLITHWMKAAVPPPPLPQGESEEDGFKKFMESYPLHKLIGFSNVMVWQHMQAAYNAALQQKATK